MNKILSPIISEIEELEPLLVKFLLTPNAPTNQILQHIFSAGGKRIRPALFLLTCRLINYNDEHKYPIAGVCEYIHTASLLHDDVIDSSTLRRNKPTVNSVWGDETAVLAGDLIYSGACRLMVKTRSLDLIDTFAECIRFMSESELFQLELLWKENTSADQYLTVVAGKTAALFEASTKTPCYLKNCAPNVTLNLGEYGKNLGFAFQIADDCLDYEGNSDALGKNLVADLAEGKVTLPLILGMQNSSKYASELKKLVSQMLAADLPSEAQKCELVELVKLSEGLNLAKGMALQYAQNARSALELNCKQFLKEKHAEAALASLLELTHFVTHRIN